MLKDELDFFIANQDRLVRKYPHKVLVIRGKRVAGVYESVLEAYAEARKLYEPGIYMIQPCEAGPQAYTVSISSRDIFA